MLHCCFRGRDIVFVFTNKYCDENKNEAQRGKQYIYNKRDNPRGKAN